MLSSNFLKLSIIKRLSLHVQFGLRLIICLAFGNVISVRRLFQIEMVIINNPA